MGENLLIGALQGQGVLGREGQGAVGKAAAVAIDHHFVHGDLAGLGGFEDLVPPAVAAGKDGERVLQGRAEEAGAGFHEGVGAAVDGVVNVEEYGHARFRPSAALRDDLDPVAVRVGDEVDAHFRVFKDDAAHLLVQGVGGGIVVGFEGQVELLFADVILLRMVGKPGELQLKVGILVAHEDDDVSVPGFAPRFLQPQGLFVEADGGVEIDHVVVFVHHSEFHC